MSPYEERNKLASDMRAMHEAAEKESRDFTPEEREKWDSMVAGIEAADARIERSRQVDGIEAIDEPVQRLPEPAIVPPEQQLERAQPGMTYEEAYNEYLRRGLPEMSAEAKRMVLDKRAQGTAPDSAGGYTVPTDLYNSIIEAMKQYGGLRNVCTVLQTAGGNPLDIPTNDDTANMGAILAENTQVAEQDTTFGVKTLGAYKYSSKLIRVSVELLQDEAVNLESYLVNILGKRIGRAQAEHFCTGDGIGRPEGIVAGATLEATAAGATAITYQDMLDLEHTVDPAYREGGVGRYLFNDATLKHLKGLVDGEGRPLWLPAIAESAPATINGLRYTIDQAMDDVATTASSVVFGDLTAYWVRDVLGIQMLRLQERYADFHQVGFLAFARTDAALVDVNAVAKLTHP